MLIDEETYCPGKTTKDEPPLRPLKPSEAMRIGAALRPQCFGEAFDGIGSCALGAWWEGMGNAPIRGAWWDIIAVPFYRISHISAYQVIARNDGFLDFDSVNWTREAIADWLEAQGQ